MASWLEERQDLARVAAVAERAIHRQFARPVCKDPQDFRDHDRPMRASGGFARGEHLGHRLGVARRIVLFVFLAERARITAAVARTAARRWRRTAERCGGWLF